MRLRHGTVLEDERPFPRGHPKNLMSDGGLEAKCESRAGVLAPDHRELMDACQALESMRDVSDLLGMIRPKLG